MTENSETLPVAKERWDALVGAREGPLSRARESSVLTIPDLIPPDGHTEDSTLPTPYQSLGARGVNNISSRLFMTIMPAGASMFRFRMEEDVEEQLSESKAEVEEALAGMENKVLTALEASNLRTTLNEVLKHLVVGGNTLLYMPDDLEAMRIFRLDQFVTLRDGSGKPIEAVIREKVSPVTLDEATKMAVGIPADKKDDVEVYTHIKWKWADKRLTYYQEINGTIVPESEGFDPIDKPSYIPLRWTAVAGESYGRSMVSEYLGDLLSLEGINKSIVDFTAAAAKIVFLLRPNGTTKAKDLAKADSGAFVTGSVDDVSVLQLEKYADFRVAKEQAEELTLRLSNAFLLRSGTVRQAERVTAEEIREMAQELEDVLGGVYTFLTRELQLPIVRRVIHILEKSNKLPKLPEGSTSITIVTGFEALGRNQTVNRLRRWLSDAAALLGPEALLRRINDGEVIKRLGTGHGVEDLKGLLKTDEEIEQAEQAAMMNQTAQQIAPAATAEAMKQAQ